MTTLRIFIQQISFLQYSHTRAQRPHCITHQHNLLNKISLFFEQKFGYYEKG
jgi:hypothetical protein